VTGRDVADYLQGQLTNDVEAIEPGGGCYAALLDRKGHIQADMRVLRTGPEEFLLDLEPAALPAALRHLETYKIGRDAEVSDATAELALISVIGPAAPRAAGLDGPVREHDHREAHVDETVRAVGTRLGADLLARPGTEQPVTAALEANGAAPVTEAAAEIVRVEQGEPRFGSEMGTETIPAEAGIVERAVDFEKGCYIGQETVARLHYKGKPNRHLRGLRLSAPASKGDVLRLGDRELGSIGTACLSPVHGPIALAIVRREAEPGDTVSVGENGTEGTVVEVPFAED
jgi:folate-binding protein YgfZ